MRRVNPFLYSQRAMVDFLQDEVMATFKHYRTLRDVEEFQAFSEVEKQKLELLFDILAVGRTGDESVESVYHQARTRGWKRYWKPEAA